MHKLLALALFIIPSILFSQEYPVKIFTTNDGLGQMQVVSTFKDSRGYIWAGTKYGFTKYNGEKFTPYKPIIGIMGMEITQFAEDKSGNLYIQSTEGICRYDGHTFTPIKHLKPDFRNITVDNNDNVFAIVNYRLSKKNKNDSLENVNWPSIKNRRVVALKYDKKRKELLAIVDSVGLIAISEKSNKLIYACKKPTMSLKNGPNGELIFEENNGIEYRRNYINEDNISYPFLKISNKKIEILKPIPFDYPFVSDGTAYILLANTTQYQLINKEIVMPNDLNISYTKNGFFLPSEIGLIFVSTNGFKYFKKEDVPYAWSVSEDKFNNIWIWNYGFSTQKWDGTKLSKITGYHKAMQSAMNFNVNKNNKTELLANDFWYFGSLKDKFGNLWQSHGNGILHFDYKKFNFFMPMPIGRSISFCLLEDPQNNLVLSGGMKSVEIYENKPPFKSTILDKTNGLNVGYYVLAMALEKPGVYWFSGGNMISRYDSNLKKWKEFSTKNGKIKARIFSDMCFDNKKTLWIGSVENGLYYYDAKADSMMVFGGEEFREPVNFVGQADDNHLMVGSLNQIYFVDLQQWYKHHNLSFKTYNFHNGYMGMETGQAGFFKDSKGILYTTSGTILSQIDPKKLNFTDDTLKTYFTKFNRNSLPFNIASQTFTSKGDVRIEFESVGENKSVESQYSYKLDDAKEWSPWQTESVVTFSKLASGSYILQVRSRTGNGDLAFSKAAALHFSVSVMPWDSPYFPIYALMILLTGAGIYLNNRNAQKIKDRKAVNERIKQEQLLQKKELDYKSQTLQVQALQVQTAQAQMNPHFTFNVLNTLQHLINGNDTVSANANLLKLSKLMRSYLDASISSEIDPNAPEKAMITLEKEIELLQMYIDFEKLKYEERFEAKINIEPTIATDFYRIPPLIIQPFVENSIIHGVIPNENVFGKISINFMLDAEESLICEIIDNGIGRQEAQKRKDAQITAHHSRGTELVEKRVKILNEMGYKINIQTIDNEPAGTKVIIKIST